MPPPLQPAPTASCSRSSRSRCATSRRSVAPALNGQLIISIAAGIRCGDLARWLGPAARIVRAMPNTPALVAAGITGLYAMTGVTAAQRRDAERILAAVGATFWVEREGDLDAVTAVSGSGPAYVFYFIEALEQAARDLGLPPEIARQSALATFAGAVKLAIADDADPATLRARVTSKGGTTERAIARARRRRGQSRIRARGARRGGARRRNGRHAGKGLGVLGNALIFIAQMAFGLLTLALLLRFYMQWVRAPYRNPLADFVNALTDFMVRPVRRIVPGLWGLDLPTLLLAWVHATARTAGGAAGPRLPLRRRDRHRRHRHSQRSPQRRCSNC